MSDCGYRFGTHLNAVTFKIRVFDVVSSPGKRPSQIVALYDAGFNDFYTGLYNTTKQARIAFIINHPDKTQAGK